jgi:glycosyltransferase involved in cell wall biosynthesis
VVVTSPAPHAAPAGAVPPASLVRVLVVGDTSDDNACDVYRTRMFVGPLTRLGVDVRYSLPSVLADGPLDRRDFERQVVEGVEQLAAEVEVADVVVFRRAYATHLLCLDCEFAALGADEAAAHVGATRHAVDVGPNLAVRRLFERLETDRDRDRRPAIVYETDDDLFRVDPTNLQHRVLRLERDLIERMIRAADLVTTSTPTLAARLAPLAIDVRVIRNAVAPAWYGRPPATDPGEGPRILFYGSVGRLRDYAACATAVDALGGKGRRIWFGAPALAADVSRVAHLFDEIHPYVAGVPAFARRLTLLRPAIGLAPLAASPFNRAKSELHWLEYTLAGAVTIATSLPGGGPYDVIRHGVDGFLVSSGAEWRRGLERLTESADLRAEIVAGARARVFAEYDVDVRAAEWADAYRHAAEHAGRGRERGRVGSTPSVTHSSGTANQNRGSRRARRRALATGTSPVNHERPLEEPSSPLPSPATLLAAYVAAQAFQGRAPLRLRLGVGGSAATIPIKAGPIADDWVTIDTAGEPDLRHDVGYGLPFADGSVEVVEAHDVVDGLGELAAVLAGEAVRVLRSGGTFRVLTADRATALARQQALQVQGVTLVGRDAVLPAFTAHSLERLLVEAGFASVHSQPARDGELIVEAYR